MRVLLSFIALAGVALGAAPAGAQPAEPPTDEPPPQPERTPEAEGPAAADPALQATYDEAFAAMVRGDLGEAAAGFDRVAAAASGDLGASARELARLARKLEARGVRFVVAEPPAATAPEGGAEPAASVARIPEDDRPGAGRIGFVAATTIASLYAGITLIDIADIDDFRAGTLLVVGATGAGFAGSLLGSRGRDITAGMADSYSTGLLLGAANGLLLASPIGFDDSSEQVLGAGLGGMALGGTTGLLLADSTRPTVGQSSLVTTLSFIGIASTGLGTAVVAPDNADGDTILLVLAGGLDAGAAAGLAMAPRITWSKSRARLVGLASFLGGLGGLGVAAIIVGDPGSQDEGRLMAATTLGGIWAGFGLSIYFSRDMEPDPRFAEKEKAAPSIAIAPTMIRRSPGLTVGGRF